MLGNRGYRGGEECDAFSRRSRRMLRWNPGTLRKLKRAFSKRMRRRAAEDARLNAVADERAGGPFVAVRIEDLG